LVVYPIISKVLNIAGGCLGFRSSTVAPESVLSAGAMLVLGRAIKTLRNASSKAASDASGRNAIIVAERSSHALEPKLEKFKD